MAFGSGENKVQYVYDLAGNLVKKTVGEAPNVMERRYRYNALARLAEVTENASSLATYLYDPFGRRIKKQAGGETIWYVYSDEGLMAELTETGTVSRSYGWTPYGKWGTAPQWMIENSKIYFYHNDHLGTSLFLTDKTGKEVWRKKSEAFGKVFLSESNTVTNNLRLPGQYFDAETSTHYNHFRNYDPETGRYLESDLIGLKGGVNRYIYALANPIINSDRFGLETCGSGWNEPLVPDNPMGFPFSDCCRDHDGCYDQCGGPSRAECDGNFCKCLKKACEPYIDFPYLRRRCDPLANYYCEKVVNNGQGAFDDARKGCPECLPPPIPKIPPNPWWPS